MVRIRVCIDSVFGTIGKTIVIIGILTVLELVISFGLRFRLRYGKY